MHELAKLPADDERILSLSKSNQRVLEAWKRGYRVNEDGDVVSPHGGGIMKAKPNSGHRSPRRRFSLRMANGPGNTYQVNVHRLGGYQKFGDKAFGDLLICHEDENELNNRLANLVLGTQSVNMMHQSAEVRLERARHAAKAQRKLSDDQVLEIRQDSKNGMTNKAMMAKYSLAAGTVSGIVNHKTYQHVECGALDL